MAGCGAAAPPINEDRDPMCVDGCRNPPINHAQGGTLRAALGTISPCPALAPPRPATARPRLGRQGTLGCLGRRPLSEPEALGSRFWGGCNLWCTLATTTIPHTADTHSALTHRAYYARKRRRPFILAPLSAYSSPPLGVNQRRTPAVYACSVRIIVAQLQLFAGGPRPTAHHIAPWARL